MKLIIAEKPSVAKTIASVLNVTSKGNNYLYNNEFIVSWCVGHLVGLDNPDSYGERYAEKPWRFENLPIIPDYWKFSVNKSSKAQFYVLKELMDKPDVSEIICATDAGREGECIFRYVYNKVGCHKPVKRLWTSSLEEKAIRNALENLKDDACYDNLFEAGLARAKADWLVGMNATRLFSIRHRTPLNVGRVQTPTLNMIVERYYQVNNFVKTPFYKVVINLGEFKATSEMKFDTEQEALNLSDCVCNSTFTITDMRRQEKTISAPKLYDLTSLQRDANRIYGYTAQKTLDYLQSLYEKKLATYPRTDSRYITDDMENSTNSLLDTVRSAFSEFPLYKCNVKQCINNSKVSDHHAILPTEKILDEDLKSLPETEYNILYLISARLLVAVAEPYIYSTVTVKLKSDKSDSLFTVSKTDLYSWGWKELDNLVRKKKSDNPDDDLPALNLYQTFDNVPSTVEQGFSSPPKLYTDDTLLSAMETAGNTDYVDGSDVEKKGLGTPATRAGIIENLVKRGYIERDGKKIIPTSKGISLISCVPDDVKSPKTTAEWETALQGIEKGKVDVDYFLNQITDTVRHLVSTYGSVDENTNLFQAQEVGICPKCGKKVRIYPKSYSCEDKNCNFVIWKTIAGKSITTAQAKKLLEKGKTDLLKGFKSKNGKDFNASLKLSAEQKVEFEFGVKSNGTRNYNNRKK